MRTDRGSTNSPGANLHARSAARRVEYMDVRNTNSPGANLHARSVAGKAKTALTLTRLDNRAIV